MLLAKAVCFFSGVILYISGVQGQAHRVCALKGSSVDLLCSPERLTSSINWYTIHPGDRDFVRKNFSGDVNRTTYNMSGENSFTLTLNDLIDSDARFYCCGEATNNNGHCWVNRIDLQVADLQVKVIPTTEGQTATLMCSTSCRLTEQPAAYIWYKNGEFLHEDWSPWYQEPVSSDKAVRYSCAIKGYEDLRAPEVSVDSVTSTCFNVTYAKGKMCSYIQKSLDEPCAIAYPTEVHIQKTFVSEDQQRLTCIPSCPLTDPQTAYRWYLDTELYRLSEIQHLTVAENHGVSCAVKGSEHLHSAEVCSSDSQCSTVNYGSRRICAVEGSSAIISSEYYSTNPWGKTEVWCKRETAGKDDAEELTWEEGRVEYRNVSDNRHILKIKNLRKNDSAEYAFFPSNYKRWTQFYTPGVTLVVTGLTVNITPSAVVTEGERVTLTCATSCPLKRYIWYLNSKPLSWPKNQSKHLLLDPVSSQHAGNYSCAIRSQGDVRSPEVALVLQARWNSIAIINVVRMIVVVLIPIPLLVFHLWMRWTRHTV